MKNISYSMHYVLNICLRQPCYLLVGLWLFTWLIVGCKKQPDPAPLAPPVVKVAAVTVAGAVGTPTKLDASGSTDPSGKSLTYQWTIKSKPSGSTATITNPDSLTASFTPDKPGTYVLTLTVTNADGLSSPVDVTITVALPGKPPVANAGTSSTIAINQQVSLNGSGSSDPDGDKLTYAWSFKSKPPTSTAAITNANQAIATFKPDVLGTYVCSLTVTDGNWPSVSADVTITAAVPAVKEVTGTWSEANGTSGANDYTPRNRFYSFDVATDNQPISFTLTSSDINVGLALYNPLGNQLQYRQYDRAIVLDQIVNAGTYSVMVYSSQRYDKGSFKLVGKGLGSEFTQRIDKRLTAADVSFGPEGGGGANVYTSRNHYYTFDVTSDNAVIDLNAQSAQTGIWLDLYDSAGKQQAYTFPATPQFLIHKLNKGTYGLWVGSGSRDAIAKYTLDLFGQVQNLKQYVYDSSILTDSYRGKNAATTYTLMVTDDNVPLDVTLRSPDIFGGVWIYDPNGSEIYYSYGANYRSTLNYTSKGQYKIVVRPDGNSSGIGNYTLSVYGRFKDLKKQ